MNGRFLIGMVLASLVAISAQAAALKVTFQGVRSGDGAILIGLYDNPGGFVSAIKDSAKTALLNKQDRLVGAAMRAKAGAQSIVFTDLPLGRYAIIVFHDENDNGLLDEDSVGIPSEGYGFSNDAKGLFSAPSFDAAAITVGKADMNISISIAYPKLRSTQDSLDIKKFLGR
jgi:uncharacterized protein (DUF2141 family)